MFTFWKAILKNGAVNGVGAAFRRVWDGEDKSNVLKELYEELQAVCIDGEASFEAWDFFVK